MHPSLANAVILSVDLTASPAEGPGSAVLGPSGRYGLYDDVRARLIVLGVRREGGGHLPYA